MLGFFKKKQHPPAPDYAPIIAGLVGLIETQLGPDKGILETSDGINRQAIGYFYGFVDAALQLCGDDIRDDKIGPPMIYDVLRLIFPQKARYYSGFLLDNIASDERMIAGALRGGNDYYGFIKQKMPPFGLFSILFPKES